VAPKPQKPIRSASPTKRSAGSRSARRRQGRRLLVRMARGIGKQNARRQLPTRHSRRRCHSREASAVAEVLASRAAVAALAAGPAQPGHTNSLPRLKALRPPRHHRPQCQRSGVPAPGGSFGLSSSRSTMCRSVRQTPQALSEIRTCPAPGRGSASSAGSKGSPARSRTIALIATQGEIGTGASAGSATSSPDSGTSPLRPGFSPSSSAPSPSGCATSTLTQLPSASSVEARA
jgi:hypothetical protein